MENVNFKAYLDEKNTITILSDKESSFTINGDFLHAYYVSRFNQYYVYKANVEIDINQKYVLKVFCFCRNPAHDRRGSDRSYSVSDHVAETGNHLFFQA